MYVRKKTKKKHKLTAARDEEKRKKEKRMRKGCGVSHGRMLITCDDISR